VTRHYLDHASTSPPRPEVVEAMVAWLEETDWHGERVPFADPGRVHTEGRGARQVLEDARDQVSELLGVSPRQVVFTSGATESVNAATWGATRARTGQQIALAGIEHSCVRQASERSGQIVIFDVDRSGRIDTEDVERALKTALASGTAVGLVHCQAANHEVGTIQPVAEVAEIAHRGGALLHVDAASALGHMDLNMEDLGADLMSVSAHKLGGPPGIGALVLRRGLRIDPFVVGGDQERARRAGLENIPAAMGFGAAAAVLSEPGRLDAEASVALRLTQKMAEAANSAGGVSVLAEGANRVPHILALAIEGVEAEPVLLALDRAGIAAHSGSSCSSEALAPSPVLEAMGVDAEKSLRLSVGWSSTQDDADAFVQTFAEAVKTLRALRT
jgi:cysteine desulfurase